MFQFLKKTFPNQLKVPLKNLIAIFSLQVMRCFAKNSFLASLYYTFFSRQFYREHLAVLCGRVAYQQQLQQPGASSALLRRNIHRLEKGLIMRPRRAVFAEDYISETVAAYVNAQARSGFCQQELNWAYAVLTQYFSVVTDTAITAKARAHFATVTATNLANVPQASSVTQASVLNQHTHKTADAAIDNSGYSFGDATANSLEDIVANTFASNVEEHYASTNNRAEPVPYLHNSLPQPAISYPQLFSLFTRRRSVRWYLPKPVPATLIDQAVAAASLAPSACNRQPYQFIVLNDNAKAAAAAKCAMGTVGFAENIPCLLVVTGDLSAYPAERDRHVIYIDAALASMQLMLALETLGLSSCPINWPDIEEREQALSNMLSLPYHQRVVMLMAVGYADPEGGIAYSQKKPTSLLIKEDTTYANRN